MTKASSNVSLFAAFSALWVWYEDGHNASCAAVPVVTGGLRVRVGESSGPAAGRRSEGPAVPRVVAAAGRQSEGQAVPGVSARPQRNGGIYE